MQGDDLDGSHIVKVIETSLLVMVYRLGCRFSNISKAEEATYRIRT